jgi:hypothetical protein
MEASERYETLSAGEIAVLRNRSKSSVMILVVMAVSFMGFAAWGVWSASWLYVITISLGGLLVIWFVSKGQLRNVLSLNRDIREGKKKIVIDRMESQRQDIRATGNDSGVVDEALGTSGPSMSYAYLLKVRGKEFKVTELQYYQCKPGQLVEIHLAPHSEHVFSLNVLKDAATKRPYA